MRGITSIWRTGQDRWRKPAIVAASLAFHAVILGYLAFKDIEGMRRYGEGDFNDPYPLDPILVEMEPRPLLRGDTARTRPTPLPEIVHHLHDAGTRVTAARGAAGSADIGDGTGSTQSHLSTPVEKATSPAASWRVRPETLSDRIARGLRASPAACASPGLLSEAERSACDDRFGQRAAMAAAVPGSGNAERDARFARQGARELATYAERREVRAAERATCDKPGPISDCEIEVKVDLFSSIDGFLPNLRRRDD